MFEKLFVQAKTLSPGGIMDPEFLVVEFGRDRYELRYYVLGDNIQFIVKPRATKYARHILEVTKTGATEVPVDPVPDFDKVYREQPIRYSVERLVEIYLRAIEMALEE